jgi:hypothetical protein
MLHLRLLPPSVVRHYFPDLVHGANDGIITTFAVVSGVVRASLSTRVILILGFANLLADGVSMGASNFLSRRSYAEAAERAHSDEATKHGAATTLAFIAVGTIPLLAYLLPVADRVQYPLAMGLTAISLFGVGLRARW